MKPTLKMVSLFSLGDVGSASWWGVLRHVGQLVADGETVEIVEPRITIRPKRTAA